MKQQTVRVTKIFTFEAAHALEGYDGPCRNIHGHSYKLAVTVKGLVQQDPGKPKDGMVMDFKELKDIVHESIISVFDHSLILNASTLINIHSDYDGKIILLPFQPSCENLICHFAEILEKSIPEPVKLCSLKLAETESSFAEWFAADR